MAEILDATSALESTTVGVFRTAATVKGGRRFSFAALVVVGDRRGQIGIGYGKANQVPPAIEKAQKEARRKMRAYPLQGRTIPHAVTGRFGACMVRLLPAAPGTGVIAGAAVRAPLEMLGVQDCLTKSFGSNNSKNLVKAVINGLHQLRSKRIICALRGVDVGLSEVEEAIQRGQAFMVADRAEPGEQAAAAADVAAESKRSEPRKPRGGRSRPKPEAATPVPAADQPLDSSAAVAETKLPPAEAATPQKKDEPAPKKRKWSLLKRRQAPKD